MAKKLSDKIDKQLDKAGLPRGGAVPFDPQLEKNKKGKLIIKKGTVTDGPKKGKMGYVDSKGRTEPTQVIPITGTCKKTAARSTFVLIRKGTCCRS